MSDIFNVEFYLNVLLHITLLFTFLNFFFKLYVSKIQSSAINNELISLINENIDSNNIHTSPIIKAELPYYKKIFSIPSDNPTIINNILFNKLTHFTIFIYIILIFFIIFLFTTNNITFYNLFYVIGENIFTFIFIGFIEYLFFTRIALKYIPVLPSAIYKLLISNIKEKFN